MMGTLFSKVLQLVGLGVNHPMDILDLSINDFAVVNVDERAQIGDGDSNQRQPPQWEELDQPVGSKGGREGLEFPSALSSSSKDNVGEQNRV
jgi:hypothetical protein